MGATSPDSPAIGTEGAIVTDQHRRFFRTFGFVRFDGLFAPDIGEITAAFEEVAERARDAEEPAVLDPGRPDLANAAFTQGTPVDSYEHVHFGRKRTILPFVLDAHPRLGAIASDPRYLAVAEGLLGPGHELLGSDGNVFDCETSWHHDSFLAPLDQYFVKLFLYLDPVERDSGALRVIPGTSFWDTQYATALRTQLVDWRDIDGLYGVAPQDIPSWSISSTPGDLIACYYRTVHATFGGASGRRLICMNLRGEQEPELA
jgi:hypothetical protein